MIGGTNMTLLNRALRADAVILKPGFAAHRLDAFYHDDHRNTSLTYNKTLRL